jgi:hypothetical protein
MKCYHLQGTAQPRELWTGKVVKFSENCQGGAGPKREAPRTHIARGANGHVEQVVRVHHLGETKVGQQHGGIDAIVGQQKVLGLSLRAFAYGALVTHESLPQHQQ